MADIGTLAAASVIVRDDGEAVLAAKGDTGTATVHIPEDQARAFRDTVRELVRVYDEDAPEPADALDTTFREDGDA